MHTALETIHDFSSPQKFGGLEGGKALEQLGKDVLSATKNFNTVLDDSSSSLPSKLFSVAKAFATAAWEGAKGCLSGMSEGFKQEKGLSAIGSAIKGALFGGFSGLASGFNKSLEKDLAAKQEQSEVVLTAPSSTNKGPPSISSPSSVELSTLGESSGREASQDEVDDAGLHPT